MMRCVWFDSRALNEPTVTCAAAIVGMGGGRKRSGGRRVRGVFPFLITPFVRFLSSVRLRYLQHCVLQQIYFLRCSGQSNGGNGSFMHR
jgi:hypothetical protein